LFEKNETAWDRKKVTFGWKKGSSMKRGFFTVSFLSVLALAASGWVRAAASEGTGEGKVTRQTFLGKVYEGERLSDNTLPEPIYSVLFTAEKGPGLDQIRVTDYDRQNNAFHDQTVDFDGDNPKAFSFYNNALDQKGTVTVTSTEILMEFTQKGQTRSTRQPRPPVFAMGPSVNRLIESHIAELKEGRTVDFKIAVPDRLAVYGMKIKSEPPRSDEPLARVKTGEWMRLRLEINDPLYGLFAPKILFVVEAHTGRVLRVFAPLPSPVPGKGTVNGTIRYDDPS
jgi:hypothetical protein